MDAMRRARGSQLRPPGRAPRSRLRALIVAAMVLAVAVTLHAPAPAAAQDTPSTGLPTRDIVPKPNSGQAPTEAGDRGGSLQLLILALVVAAVTVAVVHLVRQSQRARGGPPAS